MDAAGVPCELGHFVLFLEGVVIALAGGRRSQGSAESEMATVLLAAKRRQPANSFVRGPLRFLQFCLLKDAHKTLTLSCYSTQTRNHRSLGAA